MFKLHLPKNMHACTTLERQICAECDFNMLDDDKYKDINICSYAVIRPEIDANHTDGDIDHQIWKATDKFCSYINKRDMCVTYHGPNHCSDKKPWAVYSHYHVTVVADRRLGCDTMYNSMVALHRKVASCHIPASQTTRFPASWANYLAQRPRMPWYSSTNDLIGVRFLDDGGARGSKRSSPGESQATLRRDGKYKYRK